MEDQLLQIIILYAMTILLLWLQEMSADEQEHFKTIPILVQVKFPTHELTVYPQLTFSVSANNMSDFKTNMKSDTLERRTLMLKHFDFLHKHVFNK